MQSNLKALLQGRREAVPQPPPKRPVGRPKGVRPSQVDELPEDVAAEIRAFKRIRLAEAKEKAVPSGVEAPDKAAIIPIGDDVAEGAKVFQIADVFP